MCVDALGCVWMRSTVTQINSRTHGALGCRALNSDTGSVRVRYRSVGVVGSGLWAGCGCARSVSCQGGVVSALSLSKVRMKLCRNLCEIVIVLSFFWRNRIIRK